MGLDMFVWRVAANDVIDDLTIRGDEDGRERDIEELWYWRKHHDLHGWMEKLYRNKGGTAQTFNCEKVRLYPHDLDALQFDLLNNSLPQTTGFFFGDNPPDNESLSNDLKFIQAARDAIAAGDAVYYDSWW
jgi:hypothetical protein